MPSIGIVVALPAEARSLVRRRLGFESLHALPGGHWLTVSGAGPERAHAAGARLIERRVSGLISWGCAAALVDSLQPGHLVLAETVVDETGDWHATDPVWRERLARNLPSEVNVHGGPLQGSRQVVDSRAAKAALHAATGHAAVDMESAAIARLARRHTLPFLAVRAIADDAAMALPDAVLRALNPRGDVRMTTLLGQLARRPGQLGELLALGRAFGAALSTLRQVRHASGPDFLFPPPPGAATHRDSP